MTKISVLMAVYNGERWLGSAVESVLNQSLKDIELVVINDGSTDASADILSYYAGSDSRMKIYNKNNTGLTDSLRYGMAYCSSPWIARIDADDVWALNKLERQYSLTNDSNVVLIGSSHFTLNENGQITRAYSFPQKHRALNSLLCSCKSFFSHSSAIFRKDVASNIGGYRASFVKSQDRDLWLRLSMEGQVRCINENLVFVRKHRFQVSHHNNGEDQRFYSYLAMLSYWSKVNGKQDPLSNGSYLEDPDLLNKRVFEAISADRIFDIDLFLVRLKGTLVGKGFARKLYKLVLLMSLDNIYLFYRLFLQYIGYERRGKRVFKRVLFLFPEFFE